MYKSYFIGLGGCGMQTVAELYKKFSKEEKPGEYLYTFIDTDEATRNALNKYDTIVRQEDFVNLGDTNPYQVYNNAMQSSSDNARRLREWCIKQENTRFVLPNQPMSDGAGAEPMRGRFGFYYHYSEISRVISSKLELFTEHDEQGNSKTVNPDIWVFASSCGGSGRSMTLDILYIINKIVNKKLKGAPDLKLVLYMPQPFIERNSTNGRYPLNAFACMWEINALRTVIERNEASGKNNKDIFKYFSAVDCHKEFTDDDFNLFRFIIPVDAETTFNTKLPIEKLYPTVANMIYFVLKGAGKGSDAIISKLSNDQELLRTNPVKKADSPVLWTTPLVSLGFRALQKPNQELRQYLKTRALYEIAHYGIVGTEMEKNEDREAEKVQFSKKYVLSHLVDIDGLAEADGDSLQAQIDDHMATLCRIRPESLTEEGARNVVRNISDAGGELIGIRDGVAKTIEADIRRGVADSIMQHGLRFTTQLLHIVDTYHLTEPVGIRLNTLLAEAEDNVAQLKTKCDALIAKGFKAKTAPAVVKAIKDFASATARMHSLKYALDIIHGLVDYPDGYLERLRNGDDTMAGLGTLVKLASIAADNYEVEYHKLALQFRSTANDVLTTYLPNLADIATRENADWAQDSLFTRLYEQSVLAQNVTDRLDDTRQPVRINDGNNNLIHYIKQIDTNSQLFVELAEKDPSQVASLFEKKIVDALNEIVDHVAMDNSSVAGKWANMSLEEMLNDINIRDVLPQGITKSQLISQISDTAHIAELYPQRQGATQPAGYRYSYVGASEPMATNLMGYRKSESHEFNEDKTLADRFIIIKMTYGLDFYSYKYFLPIQSRYFAARKDIMANQYGCHIHQAFRYLDLGKALEVTLLPRIENALRLIVKSAYYQRLVDTMQKTDRQVYNNIMGLTSIEDLFGDFGFDDPQPSSDAAASFSLSGDMGFDTDLGGGLQGDYQPDSATPAASAKAAEHFFDMGLDVEKRMVTIKSTSIATDGSTLKIGNDTDGTTIGDDGRVTSTSITIPWLDNALAFFRSVIESDIDMNILESINEVDTLMAQNKAFADAARRIAPTVKKALLSEKGTKANPLFGALYTLWSNGAGAQANARIIKFIVINLKTF